MSDAPLARCYHCRRDAACPFPRLAGEIVQNPGGEHCAITRVGANVHKHLKPQASLEQWQARATIAAANPDLFVPFEIRDRVVIQAFVAVDADEAARRAQFDAALEEIKARQLRVYDVSLLNFRGSRFIDFAVMPRRRGLRRDARGVRNSPTPDP